MIKFQIKQGHTYSFKLKSDKGYTLLKSVNFESKEELNQIANNLNNILQERARFERKTNHNGDFTFSLKDENGKILGNSKKYSSEAGMENGIKNLKKTIDFNDYNNTL
ncbi:YegP family protein [Cellulophaga sp. HaHaR_3_176]|uniref:YegP family protein n=1 Tax=Cellulophaga sp. HaHaR_3_176 TaxID=1942464 RepID=UPI001C1F8878|nr:YegP family protein [Cellulophaga sp. HaHaR_3_176]QWX85442.1 YegP family protein [Cellulophaga sp. HaHaR_3_176]